MELIMEFQLWLLNNPLISGIFFILMWFKVVIGFSKITDWDKLALKYRTSDRPDNKLMRAVQIHWSSSMMAGNIYTLEATSKGMYLGVLFLFRPGHPPLHIPWSDIKTTTVRRTFRNRVQMSFGSGVSKPFEISESVAKKLKADSNGQFSY